MHGLVRLAITGLLVTGCSVVPNLDEHGSGCANTGGNGPRPPEQAAQIDSPGIPLAGIAGLTPVQAVVAAGSMGHVVVFRQDGNSCVCIAPAGYGPVSEGWWGGRGQLYVDLEGVDPRGEALPDGTGC
jgi:hypothetical protein